ncbi:cytochrome c oxidase subunit II [Alicyclobacillus mengziensis]|uniref:Cytochrome c oxidase subunit 2 n=1 Tax=Alicyclobacillus mengziensis TaxID=2931921 RepID=A0A9X7Z734_9BACL|nr:cytochrome c oxidase subunit II [Alicyclobacillus mengziensis]
MRRTRRWLKTGVTSAILVFLLTGCGVKVPVLQPKGPVGQEELKLIVFPFILMAAVALIVFALFAWIMIKYRARPDNEDYIPPETDGNTLLETIWTVIPVIIVVAIAIPTVIVTFKLLKPPAPAVAAKSNTNPNPSKQTVVIYVASDEWKWLFAYPQYGIETVNHIEIPVGQPVDFQLTAIGPMNSFWIPALGGMEMDMPGKDLGLWLQADSPGTYLGRSAQYSGAGFAHMTFNVTAKSQADFAQWVKQVKANSPKLTTTEYQKLLQPSTVGTMDFVGFVNPNEYNGSKYKTGMPGVRAGMPIPSDIQNTGDSSTGSTSSSSSKSGS